MEAESSDVGMSDLPALPEDAASAWAAVLLDLFKRQTQQEAASDGQEERHDEHCLCN